MGFVQKKNNKPKEEISSADLFEKFMFEIGQYSRGSDGSIILSGSYISSNDIKQRFSDWKKKKNY